MLGSVVECVTHQSRLTVVRKFGSASCTRTHVRRIDDESTNTNDRSTVSRGGGGDDNHHDDGEDEDEDNGDAAGRGS